MNFSSNETPSYDKWFWGFLAFFAVATGAFCLMIYSS